MIYVSRPPSIPWAATVSGLADGADGKLLDSRKHPSAVSALADGKIFSCRPPEENFRMAAYIFSALADGKADGNMNKL